MRDQRIAKVVELSPPETLLEELPLGGERSKKVVQARQEVVEVLSGRDPRLMVVVGPCSVHDPKAALEYASRLGALCTAAKNKNITVWVIAFGTDLTDMLRNCASSGRAFQADNAAELNVTFSNIASQIAKLRVSK